MNTIHLFVHDSNMIKYHHIFESVYRGERVCTVIVELRIMTRRFEGFPTAHGLVVLDTFTGETALHPFSNMMVKGGLHLSNMWPNPYRFHHRYRSNEHPWIQKY